MKHVLEIAEKCKAPMVKVGDCFYLSEAIKRYIKSCAGLELRVDMFAGGDLLIEHENGGARFSPLRYEEYSFLMPTPQLYSEIKSCMAKLRLIASRPTDVKLLKAELKRDFNDETIRQARKNLKTLGEL